MPIAPPGPETRVYDPAELNAELRVHLEAGFPRLWLAGELSNLSRPASGHWYFTVKDARAQVRCALFRGQRTNVAGEPANGDRVLVRGRISLYEARGDCQLIADAMLPAGSGALQQAFEALKKKLDAEGLFDPARKRPLPTHPRSIAVVTSPTGAAVRDILTTLRRRWPAASVRVFGAPVQGDQAVPGLLAALDRIARDGDADVAIIARGGGSLEDLWAFNDESLARKLSTMPMPVVSGVGHETDFTIADFVADHRAATPTAAAETVTPDGPALMRQLSELERRLERAHERRMQQRWQHVDGLERRLRARHPARVLSEARDRLDQARRRSIRAMRARLQVAGTRLDAGQRRLATSHPARRIADLYRPLATADGRLRRSVRALLERHESRLGAGIRALDHVSPLAILARGYALIEDERGRILSRREDFRPGQIIGTRVRDLRIESEVRRVDDAEPPANDGNPR